MQDSERSKIFWVIRLRTVVTIVLTGTVILTSPEADLWIRVIPVVGIALVVFAANALWSFLLRRDRLPALTLSYYQSLFDLVAVSLVVYRFGAEGITGFLFLLVIISSGVLLPKRGTVLMASASSVAYMFILLIERAGLSNPLPPVTPGEGLLPVDVEMLIDITIKVFFFSLVALACANLQEMLSKAMREAAFMSEFNQSVVRMIPIGVMVLDSAGRIVLFNPAMERITFRSRDDAIAAHLGEIFPGLDLEWERALSEVEKSGEEVRLLGTQIPIPGGRKIRANVRLHAIEAGGSVLGILCTIQTASR